ncbi:MAG TPA: hypothetical protein VFU33_07235 [Gaiellaceae bacterium]|nr:hypothetical protein [Gaiellaceae bacterium]
MGSWYWIGVSAGLGTAAGVLVAGALGAVRRMLVASGVVAVIAGGALGFAIDEWQPGGWIDVVVAAIAGLLGLLGAAQVVGGALRRGGTRGGTGTLVGGGAIVLAAVAWIPVVGYLEAVALPAVAARLRRTQPERYAGLRTLARDE